MGKRLRSLASVLWDSDTEQPQNYFGVENNQHGQQRELQLENDSLKSQVHDLTCEVEDLKKRLATMSQLQNDMVPPFTLETMSGTDEWVCKLRKDVVYLPRLHVEILPELADSGLCKGCIEFDLPDSKANASQVTRHGERIVSKLSSKYPAVFKIGITTNPVRRWLHPTYGYSREHRERWQGMKIWSVTASSFSVALLESFVISKFKGTPGCRNENPGGESACPGDGPHFAYVVYRILVPPPRVRSRA